MPNLIALAIPLFFLFIGLELWVARRRGVQVYRLNDGIVDVSCGILQQVFLVFCAAALVAAYVFLYERCRLFTFAAASLWPWLIAVVLVDFTYYWWHRLSHRVNFLWAAHVVHHQSEDYNLAVALRQSVATVWTILPFHLPLALLGIPPLVFLTVDALSTLYQFWIHTRLIGKLGWFELVFNTPAQHRVHHASNARYLDRNYAATFCIWDRLFGTFQDEDEAPVFGLVKPLDNFNPLWAQVHGWADLSRASASAPRFADGLRIWFRPPEFQIRWLGPSRQSGARDAAGRYDPPIGPRLSWWLALQLGLAAIGTTALILQADQLAPTPRLAASAWIVATVVAAGGLIEGRRWAPALEVGRWAVLFAAAALWWARAL
ncbi:MAG: sterol desaturase family protein [Myxococcales bacterium]